LPTAAYSEKDAIYMNLERRPQSTVRATFAPGEAKEDWLVILQLAEKFGFDLGFKNLSELRKNLAQSHSAFANFEKISKSNWINSTALKEEFLEEKLAVKNFDFYLTNPIARASRTLNKCSTEFSQS
jgi:NADH-quinone oxidoreductase subunit G